MENFKKINEAEEASCSTPVVQANRKVPSPLDTPKTSILKRRFANNITPNKRKRVEFSDPPTTCIKFYIKDKSKKRKKEKKSTKESDGNETIKEGNITSPPLQGPAGPKEEVDKEKEDRKSVRFLGMLNRFNRLESLLHYAKIALEGVLKKSNSDDHSNNN